MEAPDPFDLTGQEVAAKDRETRARLEAKVENDDFLWLTSSKRGRRIVWRWLEKAGVFQTSFSTDALQMAFNEGRRNTGLATIAMLMDLCPERYQDMVIEAKARAKNERIERSSDDDRNDG